MVGTSGLALSIGHEINFGLSQDALICIDMIILRIHSIPLEYPGCNFLLINWGLKFLTLQFCIFAHEQIDVFFKDPVRLL